MKYLGGKQRLGKHIAPILKDIWATYESLFYTCLEAYLEPFCGSLGEFAHFSSHSEVSLFSLQTSQVCSSIFALDSCYAPPVR